MSCLLAVKSSKAKNGNHKNCGPIKPDLMNGSEHGSIVLLWARVLFGAHKIGSSVLALNVNWSLRTEEIDMKWSSHWTHLEGEKVGWTTYSGAGHVKRQSLLN